MEEQGLASVATYGTGEGNTIKHYYAGKGSKSAKAKTSKNNKSGSKE